MKKILLLFTVLLTLTSCGDELVFNNPAFIANHGDELWEATNYRATVDNLGYLIITGVRELESINLKTNNTVEDDYALGDGVLSSAIYDNGLGTVYTTNIDPDSNVQVYPAEGNITISEFNLIERTVSGTFYFQAFENTGLNSAHFDRGYFYNVPILSIGNVDTSGQSVACQNASAVVATTQTNFENIDQTGPDYSTYCSAYKTALQVEKQQCGDPDGTIQDIIDELEDCTN